jgi:protein-tyrosine phosphatase
MLKQAADDGVLALVCTPHILKPADFENEAFYFTKFDEFSRAAKAEKINLDLYLGSEIYIQPDIPFQSRLATLNNNGKYFLTEFPMTNIPRFAAEMLFQLIAAGKVPIIAHPERNVGFLRRPELAYQFVQRGMLFQVNAGSLRGHFGAEIKKLAELFINHQLVHFIASDCHEPERRRCHLKETRDLVVERWGEDMANDLFLNNAQAVLKGKELNLPEPRPINLRLNSPWKKFLGLFKKFRN